MTVADMETMTLRALSEEGAVFHTSTNVRDHLSAAELFLSLLRALAEKTVSITLFYNTPVYIIHNYASDFLYPLRAAMLDKQLLETTLATANRNNTGWYKYPGKVKSYIPIGGTLLAFVPNPSGSVAVKVTYAAQPATLVGATSATVGNEWHEAMVSYAAAILAAKGGQIPDARRHMESFKKKLAMRDARLIAPEKKGSSADVSLEPPVHKQVG